MERACISILLLLASLAGPSGAWTQSCVNAVEPDRDQNHAPAPRPARYDSIMLRDNFIRVKRIADGLKPYHDSTAVQVMMRHKWNDVGMVVDWTASMLAHNAKFVGWYFQQADSGNILHFSFFNDGDGKYDDEKLIGLTGGIYHCPAGDSMALWNTIEGCVKGGNGGDHRENVLEALLEAFYECPTCEEFVIVADNSAPIRDFSLIDDIDRPVHVVLVGVYKDGILPDYLNLAYRSGGSIHTREGDHFDLSPDEITGILRIGTHRYIMQGGGYQKMKELD